MSRTGKKILLKILVLVGIRLIGLGMFPQVKIYRFSRNGCLSRQREQRQNPVPILPHGQSPRPRQVNPKSRSIIAFRNPIATGLNGYGQSEFLLLFINVLSPNRLPHRVKVNFFYRNTEKKDTPKLVTHQSPMVRFVKMAGSQARQAQAHAHTTVV